MSTATLERKIETTPRVTRERKTVKMHRDRQKEVKEQVIAAASLISPAWPLHSFIAVNPLQGLESCPFPQAMEQAAQLFEQERDIDGLAELNRQSIKFCQAFFDDGQSTLPMPYREDGLYAAWRKLARYDNSLARKDEELKSWLAALPNTPEAAIQACFTRLKLDTAQQRRLLQQLFATLPGWAGYVKYRSEWCRENEALSNPATLMDYAALRCVLAVATGLDMPGLLKPTSLEADKEQAIQTQLAQMQQAEQGYQQALQAQLAKRQPEATPSEAAEAQLVFCIDVRSEPFRRAIEAQGRYETFGFAGFFGVPLRVADTVRGRTSASCPAFVEPQHDALHPHHASHPHGEDKGNALIRLLRAVYHDVKHQFITPFALAETSGLWCGLWMTLRMISPRLYGRISHWAESAEHSGGAEGSCSTHLLEDISAESRVQYAESALRLIGLTKGFAPLVVLCGHGSTTTNNPFASALDCGACGGNHGGDNAKALAAILNDSAVRQQLETRGIAIPQSTRFIAGLHDTTTDALTLFESVENDAPHQDSLHQLQQDLAAAKATNQQYRYRELEPQAKPLTDVSAAIEQRSVDWSQTQPEWGLAGNAALIIGPRSLTKHSDLAGRSFLHSYDPAGDDSGELLETILSGPMVVTQWINSHYLFASLNPALYGSGSKVTQNVAGTIGIMQGNASDLMYGLPMQSLAYSDHKLNHQLQRLQVVIYAPKSRVETALKKLPSVAQLVNNQWVHVTTLDPKTQEFSAIQ